MKTKHTPGPWKVVGESTLNIISYHIPKGRKICSLLSQSTEDFKNAALIAAAPEMLEMLETILNETDDAVWVSKIESILNKAKGE